MVADPLDENSTVCFCFGVTQQEVLAVIQRDDVHCLFDVMDHCKAGNGCNSCWSLIETLLALKSP